MNIGVDATCWQNTRGYGRHARALLSALVPLDPNNRYTFVLDSHENSESIPPAAEIRLVQTSAPTTAAASAKGHRALSDLWRMSHALSSSDFDVVFFPTIYSYVPVSTHAKKIVMIHDVIADRFPQLTLPSRSARLFWNAKVAVGRRQADVILTVSNYSRQALAHHFQIPPDRIAVVGEASDPVFRILRNPKITPRLERLSITPGERILLYVGGFAPHKNLETLISAFSSVSQQPEFADVRLVMVGENQNEIFHSYFATIKTRVSELGLGTRVIFTGYLPDEELVVLLNCATVLALPSLMEGFGLPAIEAAACGCPVIATSESPLPDLLGTGGLYVAPLNLPGWQSALTQVIRSPELRAQMRSGGLAAARGLTWEHAAQQLREIIGRLL